MKWEGRRSSDNVRKQGSSGRGGGGFRSIGSLGGGGIILLLAVSLLLGQNPLDLLLGGGFNTAPSTQQSTTFEPRNKEEAETVEFLGVVLADTEDMWNDIFSKYGQTYREPKLVLYQNTVNSGCGFASSRMGPFYCGADETVYIDATFIEELRTTFAAEGDFPFAYVLAHEVGHHIQKLTGDLEKVHALRGRVSEVEYNNEMVKLELQADYYAGVLAHYLNNKGYLDSGDVKEGMAAASGVGDDRIQEMQGGQANPDTFQHGRSEQREKWFLRGFEYGDLEHGNTFDTKDAKNL